MSLSAELAAELERVQERLSDLPHPLLQSARDACHRVALEAHRDSLERQLSTAVVQERRLAVENAARGGENPATPTSTPSAPVVAASTAAAH